LPGTVNVYIAFCPGSPGTPFGAIPLQRSHLNTDSTEL